MTRKSLIRKFDKQANKYNKRRNNDSAYRFRNRVFRDAEGKVLEVGVGSGLNFPFYNKEVELTGVDFSSEMLRVAESATKEFPFQAAFIQEDVESAEFMENTFDTIVSSGTLCAYQDPVAVLNNFQRWCKPEGKILMMEHGISTNKLLAWLQKGLNPLAYKVAGCHQDRDISEIIKNSRLKLIRKESYMAGCLYLIWAKP